jgi:hypothetical protein
MSDRDPGRAVACADAARNGIDQHRAQAQPATTQTTTQDQHDRSKLDLSWIDESSRPASLPREFYFYASWGALLVILSVLSLPFRRLER